ncbi:MAG: carotenoid 1,2-hydratase [Pseudomonadota bacterium]
MSDDGQFGFSIIALIGTVFSPYYAFSGRHDPHNHVALNVGLYGKGIRRWTMTERGRNSLSQTPTQLQIGPSALEWHNGTLVVTIDERGAPLPQRVRGTIRLTPQGITAANYQLDFKGRHFWHPIAPSARAQIDFEFPKTRWSGDAYFDSNWGSEPLEAGFSYWDWSRAVLADGAGIYYDAVTKDGGKQRLALLFDKAGSVQEIDCPEPAPMAPGPIWRVARSAPAARGEDIQTLAMLEDTPFYTRSKISIPFNGHQATAIHESLDLDRFSKTWVRCLLTFRMPRNTFG